MQQAREDLDKPLMSRRSGVMKPDPVEELNEVHAEIKNTEKQFKKILEVCAFLIDKNKELFTDLELLDTDNESLFHKASLLEDEINTQRSQHNQTLDLLKLSK